ncbi:Lipopolysaccharide-responsive and beige-like anchor protein [Bagarius yarrelli]|uniref:Lipopolysaccharide-responsive and beige-like anchor protein n=1 Tax=Bagarius yarrelli TaxID=175774 RepID=A0A556VC55_BAGYA|nr:Lipopolysaccharide-responsive and beige-like anchor protein [Bagarius yarrelli]
MLSAVGLRPLTMAIMRVTLVGGQFDLELNFIIQEPESIPCTVDLLEKCEVTCQAEVWSMFTAVLKKSVRNLQACTDVGLITLVLQRIDRAHSMIAASSCCEAAVGVEVHGPALRPGRLLHFPWKECSSECDSNR